MVWTHFCNFDMFVDPETDECIYKERNKKVMTTPEMINPDHYKNETSLECIEVMEMLFDKNVVVDFCVGNAWKYIWRWKNKGGQTDLHKATWYINRAYKILDNWFGYTGDESKIRETLKSMEEYIDRYKIGEIENE